MEHSNKSARELFAEVKKNPTRKRFGFGQRPALINVDLQMASAFHETSLNSLFNFHKIDTVVVTGGSTSGCVRATVVDSLQRSFRTIVPEECVADKHESPHFANLYDMALKYADVVSVSDVLSYLKTL